MDEVNLLWNMYVYINMMAHGENFTYSCFCIFVFPVFSEQNALLIFKIP